MSHQRILLFICFFLSFQLSAQYTDSIFTNADQMPYFPGCSAFKVGSKELQECSNQSVKAFIFNHIIYPQEAKDANIEGAVYVQFTIDELGQVTNPKILRDIGGNCGAEALRMLEAMPKWVPAVHQGHKVKVVLNLPIHFYFKDDFVDISYGYNLVWGKLNDYEVTRKDLRKNLQETPIVLDAEGESVTISELSFSYNKNNKITSKASNGRITTEMENFIKKLKKGGFFSVIATIQKEGNFIEVDKEFVIVK